MVIVYLDLEYSNGNLYVGDIIEIAAIGGESGWIYHTCQYRSEITAICYIFTGIIDETLRTFGVSFKDAFKGLSDFIRQELESNPSALTLISHGGILLLLTNYMKNDVDYGFLTTATFVDSVKAFKDSGYYKAG